MVQLPPLIATAAELNERLHDSSTTTTLVSIDLEGEPDNVLEIGLAICSRLSPTEPGESHELFAEKNDIKCETIRLREPAKSRGRKQEYLRFGKDPQDIDSDPEATISRHLHRFSSHQLILVVFDAQIEMKWASRSCPDLLQLFSAYVDVQTFAADASYDKRRPSLRHCLRSLDLFDSLPNGKPTSSTHRAGNDVVYTLAILAALSARPSDVPPLTIGMNTKRPRFYHGRPRPTEYYPFTVQIRTIDRTPLPVELDSAGKVYTYFSSFNPLTAGSGPANKNSPKKEQLSWCWICFPTKVDLDAFLSSANHITCGGKEVIIESHYIPG